MVADKPSPYQAFQYKAFRFFISTRFIITIAVQIQNIVLAWLIYSITGSPLSLGLIGLAEALPSIGVTLFAGYWVDNHDRRTIAIIALSIIAISTLSLFTAYWANSTGVIIIAYACTVISGLGRGIMAPAVFSMLPQIVPKANYANATTWNSSSWQIASVIGPGLGGLLYAWIGPWNTLIVVISLLLAGILCFVQIPAKGKPENQIKEPLTEALMQGIRFVFEKKIILSAISLDLFAVLFGGAVALLPIFARDILMVGPQGLGYLRAAPALGSALTMIFLAYFPPSRNSGKKLLLCVMAFGLATIGFALSTSFWVAMVMLFLTGAFDSVSVVIRSTILQLMTPDHMRGRVSAVNTIFIGSSNEIGAFESGVTAKWFGTIPSVLIGGCMTLLVVAVSYVKSPQMKNFQIKDYQ